MSLDSHPFLLAWDAFARDACDKRIGDHRRQVSERARLEARPVEAVVAWLREQPFWQGLNTPVHAVVDAVAAASTRVLEAQRVNVQLKREWIDYKHDISHHPRAGSLMGAPARGWSPAYIDAAFSNLLLDCVRSNPFWQAASCSVPHQPTMLFELEAVVRHGSSNRSGVSLHTAAMAVGAAPPDLPDRVQRSVGAIDRALIECVDAFDAERKAWQRGPLAEMRRLEAQLRPDDMPNEIEAACRELERLATQTSFQTRLDTQTHLFRTSQAAWLARVLTCFPEDYSIAADQAGLQRVVDEMEAEKRERENVRPGRKEIDLVAYRARRHTHLVRRFQIESGRVAVALLERLHARVHAASRLAPAHPMAAMLQACDVGFKDAIDAWRQLAPEAAPEPEDEDVAVALAMDTHAHRAQILAALHTFSASSAAATTPQMRASLRAEIRRFLVSVLDAIPSTRMRDETNTSRVLRVDDALVGEIHLLGTIVQRDEATGAPVTFHSSLSTEFMPAVRNGLLADTWKPYQSSVLAREPRRLPMELKLQPADVYVQWTLDAQVWQAYVSTTLQPELEAQRRNAAIPPAELEFVSVLLRRNEPVTFGEAAQAMFALFRSQHTLL